MMRIFGWIWLPLLMLRALSFHRDPLIGWTPSSFAFAIIRCCDRPNTLTMYQRQKEKRNEEGQQEREQTETAREWLAIKVSQSLLCMTVAILPRLLFLSLQFFHFSLSLFSNWLSDQLLSLLRRSIRRHWLFVCACFCYFRLMVTNFLPCYYRHGRIIATDVSASSSPCSIKRMWMIATNSLMNSKW